MNKRIGEVTKIVENLEVGEGLESIEGEIRQYVLHSYYCIKSGEDLKYLGTYRSNEYFSLLWPNGVDWFYERLPDISGLGLRWRVNRKRETVTIEKSKGGKAK